MSPLRLRVDVCTHEGLHRGVPVLLDLLRRCRARATFCVTLGPDRSGLAVTRLLHPGFARRLLRQQPHATYGWRTALYGTLWAAPRVGAGAPDLLRQIRDEGHEVIPHGWDHRGWQDRLDAYPASRLQREFFRMIEAYERIFRRLPEAFAAPAWRTNAVLLELEANAGLRYASDARGTRPFRPTLAGRLFPVPQLPVTLPTLDEAMGIQSPEAFAQDILRRSRLQIDYACYAAHAETEGRRHPEVLVRILAGLERPILPLGEAVPNAAEPRTLIRTVLPGRPYPVAAEGPPL